MDTAKAMNSYATICPKFWQGETGTELRKTGPDAVLVALYLVTNPHANRCGLYHLPPLFLAYETGLSIERAQAALRACEKAGFVLRNAENEHVYVRKMAYYQYGPELKPEDLRVKGLVRELNSCGSPFLSRFCDDYASSYSIEPVDDNGSLRIRGLKAPTKGQGKGQGNTKSQSRTKKDVVYTKDFLRFWKAYPKKKDKREAAKAWEQVGGARFLDAILDAIERETWDWREGGRYVKYPATWLRRGAWEDEFTPPPEAVDADDGVNRIDPNWRELLAEKRAREEAERGA